MVTGAETAAARVPSTCIGRGGGNGGGPSAAHALAIDAAQNTAPASRCQRRATLPRMALKHALLMEFDHEMESTRKLLTRVPDDRLAWTPHDKSMTLGGLALHIAGLPAWGLHILERTTFDLSEVPSNRDQPASARQIVDCFTAAATTTRSALDKTDAEFAGPWTLTRGREKMFSMPKSAALRSFVFSHLIHHRGQLSVYLRLIGIAVPAIYGPSADEF